jgi:hypothetical protein
MGVNFNCINTIQIPKHPFLRLKKQKKTLPRYSSNLSRIFRQLAQPNAKSLKPCCILFYNNRLFFQIRWWSKAIMRVACRRSKARQLCRKEMVRQGKKPRSKLQRIVLCYYYHVNTHRNINNHITGQWFMVRRLMRNDMENPATYQWWNFILIGA